jgi:hypothetical protein
VGARPTAVTSGPRVSPASKTGGASVVKTSKGVALSARGRVVGTTGAGPSPLPGGSDFPMFRSIGVERCSTFSTPDEATQVNNTQFSAGSSSDNYRRSHARGCSHVPGGSAQTPSFMFLKVVLGGF